MRNRHEVEAAELREKWSDSRPLYNYNKSSASLQRLRRQEKSLALAGDFTGAAIVRKLADKQEREETERAQARLQLAARAAFNHQIERHDRELQGHMRLCEKALRQAEVLNETELNPLRMAVRKLEQLSEQNLRERKSPRGARSALDAPKEQRSFNDGQPVVTLRTMKKLSDLHNSPGNGPLSLQPLAQQKVFHSKKGRAGLKGED
jgi:hypothetical protein